MVEGGENPRSVGLSDEPGALRVIGAHNFFMVKKVEPDIRHATGLKFESLNLKARLIRRRQFPRVDHRHGPVLQIGTDPWDVAAILVTPREDLAVFIKRMLSRRAQVGNRGGPDCVGRRGCCGGHDVRLYLSCLPTIRLEARRVKPPTARQTKRR